MLSQDLQEDIHRLWDELADFEVGHTEAATRHLMERLCVAVGAWNATWGGAVRLEPGAGSQDPLQGWRVTATRLLHPMEAFREDGPFDDLRGRWNRRETDPSFMLPLRNVGAFRTYGLRRDLPPAWFDDPFYEAYYGRFGTLDAIWVGYPINDDAESHFGFYSRSVFTAKDVTLLAHALRGVRWFHRQAMLTAGQLVARESLTPTERKVLRLLLTKAAEKEIAQQLGLAPSTTHQRIVALFRKFGVRSRAELMSLWLSHPT